MIQRIQTVYLLLSTLCTGSLFFISMGKLSGTTGLFSLQFKGLIDLTNPALEQSVQNTWPLSVLIVFTTLLSLVAIFMFKRRISQMRVCGVNMGLLAGLSGLIWYTNRSFAQLIEGSHSYGIGIFLPMIALVLTALAIRSIGKDEALIRSMNRLR